MKKLVYFLGILFLLLIVVLNILFSTRMDTWELVTISFNNPLYVLSFILLGIAIFALAYFIDKHLYNDINPEKKKKLRKILFGVAIGVYILFSLLWVIFGVGKGDKRPAVITELFVILPQLFIEMMKVC